MATPAFHTTTEFFSTLKLQSLKMLLIPFQFENSRAALKLGNNDAVASFLVLISHNSITSG